MTSASTGSLSRMNLEIPLVPLLAEPREQFVHNFASRPSASSWPAVCSKKLAPSPVSLLSDSTKLPQPDLELSPSRPSPRPAKSSGSTQTFMTVFTHCAVRRVRTCNSTVGLRCVVCGGSAVGVRWVHAHPCCFARRGDSARVSLEAESAQLHTAATREDPRVAHCSVRRAHTCTSAVVCGGLLCCSCEGAPVLFLCDGESMCVSVWRLWQSKPHSSTHLQE